MNISYIGNISNTGFTISSTLVVVVVVVIYY